ncbi:Rho termination factor N-terminal domain-containing protein [Myxosarcina sp. GI1]|uniref:Rho termination factor N-terminal domain-containing protein n=1 Tax=Myxosarcina sp. GI1 TaxID=1541065 RepID=UPI0009DCFF25|nr:Rho termination factor N-terminal domain-containing protein [Myxosarcina sp. GI1]
MSQDKYEEKYTKPQLRRQIKDELMESDKGGKPGQWSARKSQLLVQEYEKQGGGYKQDEKDDAAESLEEWSEQDWQTESGNRARQDDKTKRYLPKEVWERLSESEKKEAKQIKQKASREGKQYVEWTPAIKRAMQEAGYSDSDNEPTKKELYEQAQELAINGRSQMNKDELQKAVAKAETDSLENQTRDELYEQAQELNIDGRSQMNKDELQKAVAKEKTD